MGHSKPSPDRPEERGRNAQAPKSRENEGHQLRVLVVDDNVDSARTLAMFLRLKGHAVDTRFDGQAALDAALEKLPDAIVLDLGLPKLDGFQVAEQLRDTQGFQHTKLIAVSGYGNDEARARSAQVGFDHHLTKPVDTQTLLALIEGS